MRKIIKKIVKQMCLMSFFMINKYSDSRSKKSTENISKIFMTISKQRVSVSTLSRIQLCSCTPFWNSCGSKSVIIALFSTPVFQGQIFRIKITQNHGHSLPTQLRKYVSLSIANEKKRKILFYHSLTKNHSRRIVFRY